ncbi:hypothetical protein DL89DRAFT_93381 [Linderina pennispora]|uniref:Uncharacterized protein n=1 Tax=Linderina pennispora TaxID=61395 RepID=A0A1Y1VQA9_9FUNG|nr:uncharacterized protein DL89DRAFT_93381 [Linderina pennispora]ORX63459.1 hypothetical protein DL89DRAFT_93381 [Linderina pennispora]
MTTFESIPVTATSRRKEMSYRPVSGLSDVDSIASDADDEDALFGPASNAEFRRMQAHDEHRRRTQVLMLLPLDDVYFNTPEHEASAVKLQAWWRSIMAQRQYMRMRSSALLIQRIARGALARRTFRRRRHELQQLAFKGSVSARRRKDQGWVPPPLAYSRSEPPLSRSEPMISSPPAFAASNASAATIETTKVRRGRSIRNWFQRSSPPSDTSDNARPIHNSNHHHHPQQPDTDPPASPTTLKPKRSILRAKIGLLGRQSPRSPEHAPMSAPAERVPMVTARVYPVVEIDKRSEEISLPQSPPMSIRSVQAAAKPHMMPPVHQPTDHNDMHSGNSARPLHVHGFQKTRAQPPIEPVHSTQSDEDPLEQGSSRIAVDSSEESETCNATHGTTVDSSMPFIPLKSSTPNVEAADMADKSEDDDMPLGDLARSSNESSAVSPMAIDEESAENGPETPVRQARKITDANLVSDIDFKDSPATASPTIAHIDSLFQMADENMAAAQQVQMKHDGEELSPRLSLRLSANASTFNNFNISAFAPSTEPIIESAEASLQDSEDSPRAALRPQSTQNPNPQRTTRTAWHQ